MNKKRDIIISLVSLVLLGAILAGCVFLFEKGDGLSSGTKETESTKVTETNTSVTPSYNDFYVDQTSGVGFVTENNVTVFFFVVESPKEYYPGYDQKWNLFFYDDSVKRVSYLPEYYAFSRNGGNSWELMSVDTTNRTTYSAYNFLKGEEILISYARVENCKNPMTVLTDLINDVFSSKIIKHDAWTGEAYISYEDFDFIRRVSSPPGESLG